ncbi:Hypothetical protein NTJ_12521 [Nesidiocoris tenuis]|uniref:Peptidase S1 domain-containing protein n=1 Tax=Nesidiocoris tenuis TaxID=355587 RepID=A0ABN7B7U0_9HEMI|nr:Hypothetical protein NTJ_12521 [Nesidiocoris tenuis]
MTSIFIILMFGAFANVSPIKLHLLKKKWELNTFPSKSELEGHTFLLKAYTGIRPQTIVLIKHGETNSDAEGRSPYDFKDSCYGVFINYLNILAPCSCFTYVDPFSGDEVNPWYHPRYGPNEYFKDEGCCTKPATKSSTTVSMLDEYGPMDNRPASQITEYECHPKVNQYYLYDYAMARIDPAMRKSKLAWIHTAEFYTFKQNMELLPLVSQSIGKCEIYQWTEHITAEPIEESVDEINLYFMNWTRIYRKKKTRVLNRFEIKFTTWDKCVEIFCPRIPKPDWVHSYSPALQRNNPYCNNKQTPRKYCVTWNENEPLCNVTRGTPVFCDISEYQRGLMGYMVDKNGFCDKIGYGAMLPLSYGIDFIAHQMWLRGSVKYDRAIPDYIKDLRGITLH